MMQNRKGQAALEYLITYGWAILIILVVLAVLWYYDVFNPSKWGGEQIGDCSALKVLGKPALNTSQLTLTFSNILGNNINITSVSVTGDATGSNAAVNQAIVKGGQGTPITVTGLTGLSGHKVGDLISLTVDTKYTDLSTTQSGDCITTLKIKLGS